MNAMFQLAADRGLSRCTGFWSCCSANEYVIRAAARSAQRTDTPLLIEATANQVNQFGGYTGMNPATFRDYTVGLLKKEGFPVERLLLGGDHLGPLTWTHLRAEEAMANACDLIASFIEAGYSKIHIDTSMRLADDDPEARLSDETIAVRAALLCRAAEEAYTERKRVCLDTQPPVYVIGSEVPIPGGAQEEISELSVTRPEDFRTTVETFRRVFKQRDLDDALSRVAAAVVQPGVEFGDAEVKVYDSAAATELVQMLREYSPLIFEGHSTDYQPRSALRAMVNDGIGILKVGPALTFALREALFALEDIERELPAPPDEPSRFRETLETAMLASPGNWQKHYHGNAAVQHYKRAYSLSDRARYYLTDETVQASIAALLRNIDAAVVPMALMSQYLPIQNDRICNGCLKLRAEDLVIDHICDRIDDYLCAITK